MIIEAKIQTFQIQRLISDNSGESYHCLMPLYSLKITLGDEDVVKGGVNVKLYNYHVHVQPLPFYK